MKNLNQVTVQGNLGKTPEVLENEHGTITYFDIACNNSFTPKGREKVTYTTWIKCQAKGNLANYISKYFKGGNRVIVTGELRNNNFEIDGKNYTTLVVKVNNIYQNSNTTSQEEE